MDRAQRVRVQLELAVRELDAAIKGFEEERHGLDLEIQFALQQRVQLGALLDLEPAVFDHVIAVVLEPEPIDAGAEVATGGAPAPPDPGRAIRAPSSFAASAPADLRDEYDEPLAEALRHA